MADVIFVLLGISFILFFGYFAEYLFKKTKIPDILFLILLGFFIGSNGLNIVNIDTIKDYIPIFTTFTLLFLIYEGALSIDLVSIVKSFLSSTKITLFNFIISSAIVTVAMIIFKFDILTSLLFGFTLGGISSAFVIPTLKHLKITKETKFILTFESAITDVLCIVSALTVVEIIKLNTINAQGIIIQLLALFSVAIVIGLISGGIWIFIVKHILKENKAFMISIAYVILVYVFTEYLKGNGAIACLILGLVLGNAQEITKIFKEIKEENKSKKNIEGYKVTGPEEELFYSEISFFVKTFFFVYIGMLINIKDTKILIIGGIIAVLLMVGRKASLLITKKSHEYDKKIISSIFARGLAAAAIAQILVINNVRYADVIVQITYTVITFTIILSSINILLCGHPEKIKLLPETKKDKTYKNEK